VFRRILALALLLAPLTTVEVGAQPAAYTVTVRAEEIGLGTGGGGFIGSGTVGTLGIFEFLCTDKANSIALPATYRAWATPLWNNTDMSKTRLGAGSLATYLANANLGSQIFAGAASPTDDALQDQIWANAFGAPGSPSQALLLANFNPEGWYVITETIAVGKLRGGKQELLAFRPNVVPEPGTYLLMATGLAGIALLTRRRRRA
jgi:hypothetical protein